MTLTSPRKALQLRMWALFMFFFIPGLLMASWATRTPAIRDILSVSTAEMGIVLFGLSIGSMSGILCSAWLVKRFGTRAVIRTTMCFAVFGMMVLSAALWFASPVLFALGLTVFGGSFGSAEVAINVEGAAVEREMNKTVLPMMHGFYSLGTLAGAGVGMALTAFGMSANLHILLAALVCIIPILTGIRAIPDGTGKNASDEQHSAEKGLPFYRDYQLMLIGVVVLIFSLQHTLLPAYALLILIGILGGFFVVPLNALLQERGKQTVGAGNAIAVQNLGENLAMLLMLGLYSLAVKVGVPVVGIGVGFGGLFAIAIAGLWMWQRRR